MMNRPCTLMVMLAVLAVLIPGRTAVSQDDIAQHRSCASCGMDRKAYGYSRTMVLYDDGAAVGLCSIHCAVLEMDADPGRTVRSLLVADRDERVLIPAEQAVWVLGGSKRGVMTTQPAWAFRAKEGADRFVASYGGRIAPWQEVRRSAN